MGAVFTIAKRDLASYLSAPKAAAIFWFFLALLGLFFFAFVQSFLNYQMEAQPGQQGPSIDQFSLALFQNIHFILLLAIPGITMGSFADEKRNHSFKLLQTAPISSLQIVLGKFFGAFFVMTAMLLASLIYPAYLVIYGNPDIAVIATSYLGVLLLVSAQLSFGLWVSSLTENQFLAFLFTMFGLFLLLILNWVAPLAGLTGSTEAFFKYAAVSPHFEAFLKGVISVGDVTYFLCFSVMFLFFTNVVVDSQRWR